MEKDEIIELKDEVSKLRMSLHPLTKRFGSVYKIFFLGVVQGIGVVVGATVLILFVSWFVHFLGLVPGFGDLSSSIEELLDYAAERR